jgi:hypothetical protein
VGVWGWFPLAFEHFKVCTLCDFGHLQFCIFRVAAKLVHDYAAKWRLFKYLRCYTAIVLDDKYVNLIQLTHFRQDVEPRKVDNGIQELLSKRER